MRVPLRYARTERQNDRRSRASQPSAEVANKAFRWSVDVMDVFENEDVRLLSACPTDCVKGFLEEPPTNRLTYLC